MIFSNLSFLHYVGFFWCTLLDCLFVFLFLFPWYEIERRPRSITCFEFTLSCQVLLALCICFIIFCIQEKIYTFNLFICNTKNELNLSDVDETIPYSWLFTLALKPLWKINICNNKLWVLSNNPVGPDLHYPHVDFICLFIIQIQKKSTSFHFTSKSGTSNTDNKPILQYIYFW